MLLVPDHGPLHSALCSVKEDQKYFNGKLDRKARYKETHFAEFKKNRDAVMAKAWIDRFTASTAVFRCVVIDWRIYQGKFFGDPFEPEALKKRRAYKKWAEMLLQPEVAKVKDAHQCLQLCDLLTGAVYRKLVPPTRAVKVEVVDYLYGALVAHAGQTARRGLLETIRGCQPWGPFPEVQRMVLAAKQISPGGWIGCQWRSGFDP